MLSHVIGTFYGVLIAIVVTALVGITACLVVLRDFIDKRSASAKANTAQKLAETAIESLDEYSGQIEQYVAALMPELEKRTARDLQRMHYSAQFAAKSARDTYGTFVQRAADAEPSKCGTEDLNRLAERYLRLDKVVAKARQELEKVEQRCKLLEDLGAMARRVSHVLTSLEAVADFRQYYYVPLNQIDRAGFLLARAELYIKHEDLDNAKLMFHEAANLVNVLSGNLGEQFASSTEASLRKSDDQQ